MGFQCFFMSNGDDSSDYDSTIDADYDPRKDQNDDDMDMDEEEPEPHEVRQLAVGGGPPVGDQQLEIEGNPPVTQTVGSATFERNSGTLGNGTLIAGEMYRKQDQ